VSLTLVSPSQLEFKDTVSFNIIQFQAKSTNKKQKWQLKPTLGSGRFLATVVA
jgi:hypothetical protein